MAVGNSDTERFPTDFRRLVATGSATAVDAESAEVPVAVSIYRPFELRELVWYCSFRVRLGDDIVVSDSGPGTDGASALFMALSGLALALERVRDERQLTWRGHDLWWVRHLVGR